MIGDKWTFLVVRGENGPVRQYSVSKRTLGTVATAGIGACVAFLVLAFTVGLDGTAALRARRLSAQNRALRTELSGFHDRVSRLETAFEGLADSDSRFREIAGLEGIDPEVLEVGVGGPGSPTPESSPLWASDSVASKSVFALSYDLNTLERRARLLAESLEEATDTVLGQRDLLESTPSVRPAQGWLTSGYSLSRMHPIFNRPLPHPGMDIATPQGSPIIATAKGKVIRSQWVVGYGLTVEIDHGHGITTLYGHASQLLVSRGQQVNRGDVIALVGATGTATAPNLHYEVRINGVPQDPARYILPEIVP